jgi:hypothetical protein
MKLKCKKVVKEWENDALLNKLGKSVVDISKYLNFSVFEAAKDYVVDLKSRVKLNLRSFVTGIIMFFNLSNAP